MTGWMMSIRRVTLKLSQISKLNNKKLKSHSFVSHFKK